MSKGDSKAKKTVYIAKLEKLLQDYSRIFIVEADNVGSQQFHTIRISLRGEATILMGKNTMIRKVLRTKIADNPALEKLLPFVKGNIGFVFTNADLRQVRDKLLSQRVEAPAKAGALAPIDVYVDAQNTGMGPEKTSFFQALGIATKIVKGTIEISSRVHLVKKGEKVGPSEATLLNMLKISPFTYGLVVKQVYDSGACFANEMLDITDEVLLSHFSAGIANVAALSLAIGNPNKASVPHLIINGFKNLLSIAIVTDIPVKGADKIKEYLADPSKFAVAAAPTAVATPAKENKTEEKKEEKKEESDEDMGFGLFD
jgi:large subunit ribosomal protein LP0